MTGTTTKISMTTVEKIVMMSVKMTILIQMTEVIVGMIAGMIAEIDG